MKLTQVHKGYKNRGSAIVEVTLIMPVVLMIMALLITMLLGVLRQAEIHAHLMLEYTDTDAEARNKNGSQEIQTYSEEITVEIVKGYAIHSEEEQILRMTTTEDKIRRWQILEGVVSK